MFITNVLAATGINKRWVYESMFTQQSCVQKDEIIYSNLFFVLWVSNYKELNFKTCTRAYVITKCIRAGFPN